MPSQILSPKRKAISDSSRAMFIWIAAMSAVVGVCAVVAIFLARQIEFKGRVVGEMTKTADTLAKNNKVAKELTSNVGVLETHFLPTGTRLRLAHHCNKACLVVLMACRLSH